MVSLRVRTRRASGAGHRRRLFAGGLSAILETGRGPLPIQTAAHRRVRQHTGRCWASGGTEHRFHRRRVEFVPAIQSHDQIPEGIVEPTLNAIGEGKVSGRVTVDLDAVRKQKARGWMDPMGYLTGKPPSHGARHALDQGWYGPIRARVGRTLRRHGARRRLIQELLTFTRRRPRSPTGSTWTIPSSCHHASGRSA